MFILQLHFVLLLFLLSIFGLSRANAFDGEQFAPRKDCENLLSEFVERGIMNLQPKCQMSTIFLEHRINANITSRISEQPTIRS